MDRLTYVGFQSYHQFADAWVEARKS